MAAYPRPPETIVPPLPAIPERLLLRPRLSALQQSLPRIAVALPAVQPVDGLVNATWAAVTDMTAVFALPLQPP